MKLYIILIVVVIIVIYILISESEYIGSLIKYIAADLNYKKKIKKNLKSDLKTRKLSNELIKQRINFLDKKLKEIGYIYKGEFKVPKNLKREIIYSRYSERTLRKLFSKITEHMGITENGVDFEITNKVHRDGRENDKTFTGLYEEEKETNNKKISVFIYSDYTYEMVLSILIHESTHYFLLSNGIRLEDNRENEYLTDIATVYFGFGKYMIEGYKQNKKILYEGEFKRVTTSEKIGYLNYRDIKYIMKKLKR